MRLTAKQVTWLKVSLHLAGLLPFLWLVWAINHGGLGADPVNGVIMRTQRGNYPSAVDFCGKSCYYK